MNERGRQQMSANEQAAAEDRRRRMAARIQAEHDPDGVEMIHFQVGSRNDGLCTAWPRIADKTGDDFRALWGVIEGKTNSVTTLYAKLTSETEGVIADPRLSSVGRREKVAETFRLTAAKLTPLADQWISIRDTMMHEAGSLAGVEPYSTAEPWQVQIDLALAAMFRSLDEGARQKVARGLALGEQIDLAEAVLRLPPSLSGLTPSALQRIATAVIETKNPGASNVIDLQRRALLAAAVAIAALAKRLTDGKWLDREDARQLLGAKVAQVLSFAEQPLANVSAQESLATMGAVLSDGGEQQ